MALVMKCMVPAIPSAPVSPCSTEPKAGSLSSRILCDPQSDGCLPFFDSTAPATPPSPPGNPGLASLNPRQRAQAPSRQPRDTPTSFPKTSLGGEALALSLSSLCVFASPNAMSVQGFRFCQGSFNPAAGPQAQREKKDSSAYCPLNWIQVNRPG